MQKQLQKTLQLIDRWQQALDGYEFEQLLKKPEPDSWSLGQVYMHLIQATLDFQLKAIERCLQSDANCKKRKNFKGFLIFHLIGGFPPVKIKTPSSREYTPKQPESKEEITKGMEKSKKELADILPRLEREDQGGKVAHPALSFLQAKEWFQLIEMHFRHHLRQKAELDQFLAKEKNNKRGTEN